MKTNEYIKKYKLDVFNSTFSKEEFLADLYKDFMDELNKKLIDYQTFPGDPRIFHKTDDSKQFSEDNFKEIVKHVCDKFWAISNKRNGYAFTEKYWGKFYQLYIHPIRVKMFPLNTRKKFKS